MLSPASRRYAEKLVERSRQRTKTVAIRFRTPRYAGQVNRRHLALRSRLVSISSHTVLVLPSPWISRTGRPAPLRQTCIKDFSETRACRAKHGAMKVTDMKEPGKRPATGAEPHHQYNIFGL
jgi:hypothetical protein